MIAAAANTSTIAAIDEHTFTRIFVQRYARHIYTGILNQNIASFAIKTAANTGAIIGTPFDDGITDGNIAHSTICGSTDTRTTAWSKKIKCTTIDVDITHGTVMARTNQSSPATASIWLFSPRIKKARTEVKCTTVNRQFGLALLIPICANVCTRWLCPAPYRQRACSFYCQPIADIDDRRINEITAATRYVNFRVAFDRQHIVAAMKTQKTILLVVFYIQAVQPNIRVTIGRPININFIECLTGIGLPDFHIFRGRGPSCGRWRS